MPGSSPTTVAPAGTFAPGAPTNTISPAVPIEQKTVVQHIQGSTQKICQLTGDTDRQTGKPTLNQTNARYGLFGTDLGFSFQHAGRTYFLFGDTVGVHEGDSIAYTKDVNPEDCLSLQFVTGSDGRYLPTKLPGISLGAYEVAAGGFSTGSSMYVFFTTDHSNKQVMGRSVLARSDDNARSFSLLYTVSTGKFINIDPIVVDNSAIPGLPETEGQGVLIWGTGTYRRSDAYLARVELGSVEDRAAWQFYAGSDPATGLPAWSPNEEDAAPLFDHPCLGEFSVVWDAVFGKWIMLYNCAAPRGINLRSADAPWGAWSDSEVIFDPWTDDGYCHFMHVSYKSQNCDSVQDTGRDNEWAGEYGPYILGSLTQHDGATATVYFVMSTWNPYEVMLMKTRLTLIDQP